MQEVVMINIPFKGGYRITQTFGANKNNAKYGYGNEGHRGLDLVPLNGDRIVYSASDGVVVRDYDTPTKYKGNYVSVWDGASSLGYRYCHLETNYVGNGQLVKKGEALGVMGGTGNTFGDHLHFEVLKTKTNGVAVRNLDPLLFLEKLKPELKPPEPKPELKPPEPKPELKPPEPKPELKPPEPEPKQKKVDDFVAQLIQEATRIALLDKAFWKSKKFITIIVYLILEFSSIYLVELVPIVDNIRVPVILYILGQAGVDAMGKTTK